MSRLGQVFARKAARKQRPRFLQPQELYQFTLLYGTQEPILQILHSKVISKFYPQRATKREMLQSRVGESSNSSNNVGSFNNNCLNTTNSFNTTTNTISFGNVSNVNIGSADERAEILAWLSPLDPWVRHHDIGDHRVEHVGDWLLGTEEYRNWVDGIPGGESDNSALFCYGDPGVGKTYIT